MAGWALGLVIVPCCGPVTTVIGIVLAIVVLVKSRRGVDHGKGLAIAALAVAALWIVVGTVFGVLGVFQNLTSDAERDADGQVSARSEQSILKIRVGDCFDYPQLTESDGDTEVTETTVEAVPCAEQHQLEAYHAFDLRDGEYPGSERIYDLAFTRCTVAFRDFVGLPYRKSTLDFYVLTPQPTGWKVLDDRTVTCVVGEEGRTQVGTLEGSRR